MAKVRGPLMSAQASGIYDSTLCFRQHGIKTTVARRPQRTAPQTMQQATHTDAVRSMLIGWRSLTTGQKATWATAGTSHGMPGYNWYFHQWFAQAVTPGSQPTP
jgi:hypothetical protein